MNTGEELTAVQAFARYFKYGLFHFTDKTEEANELNRKIMLGVPEVKALDIETMMNDFNPFDFIGTFFGISTGVSEIQDREAIYKNIVFVMRPTKTIDNKLNKYKTISDFIIDNSREWKDVETLPTSEELRKLLTYAFWFLLYQHANGIDHPGILELATKYLEKRSEYKDDYYEAFTMIMPQIGYKKSELPAGILNPVTNSDIESLRGQMPEKHSMSIQKLANELQHDIINSGALDLVVANKGKKTEISTYVLATYEDQNGVTIQGKQNYTEFDRQIQDAVCSLYEYGNDEKIFTPDMLFRAMTHKRGTNPSPQQVGAVRKSIEKQRRIHVYVDATEEMKKRGVASSSVVFDDFLLSLKAVNVRSGNKTITAYKINAEPILLTYAKMTKQLATVPAELLDIKEVTNGKLTDLSIANSDARIAVKGYLLRRIAVMKRNQNQSNIILFSTLFEETGLKNDSNAVKTKQYAFQVLDFFTAKGFVKGYEKRKSGNSYDAIVILR